MTGINQLLFLSNSSIYIMCFCLCVPTIYFPIMLNMNAKIVGCGEKTIVLSHGYGGSQSVWDDVLLKLSQRNRVLLFDWGFSSSVDLSMTAFDSSKYNSLADFAEDLICLLDEMKMKGVIYVGHSMAGMIGCIASVKRPDLFSHLVLVGASPRYLNAEDYEGGFERKEIENIFSAMGSNFTAWAKSFAASLAMGEDDPIPMEKFCKSFLAMKPETALSVAKIIFLSDSRDVLEKVEVPCTIIQGTNDVAVPISVAHYMESKLKGKVWVEIIEDDGHFPQLTSPDVLIEILDRVLVPNYGRNYI